MFITKKYKKRNILFKFIGHIVFLQIVDLQAIMINIKTCNQNIILNSITFFYHNLFAMYFYFIN